MEAWVWPSDWGLASVDCKCLQLISYAKFSGAPLTVHESANPFWTAKSDLPVFRHNELEFASFGAVVNHLRTMKYSADYNLTSKQQAEVVAFSQLMEEKLYPALLHVFWLDSNNHGSMTRPWFFSKMSFPLKFYYPKLYFDRAMQLIESRFGISYNENDRAVTSMIETAVYKSAEECLIMMSERLGDQPYLFGQAPSSADAMLYGYLAPLLKAPFPNATLQNHLKACENLVKFVSRITLTYFSKIALDYEKSKLNENEDHKNNKDDKSSSSPNKNAKSNDDDEPISKTRLAIAGTVAASAMTAYAFQSGFVDILRNVSIQIVTEEDDDEMIENDYNQYDQYEQYDDHTYTNEDTYESKEENKNEEEENQESENNDNDYDQYEQYNDRED